MSVISKPAAFDVLVNARGEILIAIDAREGEPDAPLIIVDGHKVLLVRSENDSLILPDVPQELISKMLARAEVLIAEADEKGLVREYAVTVQDS